jgi:hypothetical protein
MSWVRYDDGFSTHEKVGRLLVQGSKGLEAVGLHVLANTWSAASRRPGFVPSHQAGILIANPRRGKVLGDLLVDAGLWHEVDGGWEFHDGHVYRSSDARQTPGTPIEVSAKRAAAGRRGGAATAAKRAARAAANADSKQQDGSKLSSNGCSPVVASNEATPVPVPTTSGASGTAADVGALVAGFVEGCRTRPPSSFVSRIGKEVRALVQDGTGADAIRGGLSIVADRGFQPGALAGAVHEHLNARPRGSVVAMRSTTEDRVEAGLALSRQLAEEGR